MIFDCSYTNSNITANLTKESLQEAIKLIRNSNTRPHPINIMTPVLICPQSLIEEADFFIYSHIVFEKVIGNYVLHVVEYCGDYGEHGYYDIGWHLFKGGVHSNDSVHSYPRTIEYGWHSEEVKNRHNRKRKPG